MKHINILIGGSYFSDDRLGFVNKIDSDQSMNKIQSQWQDVLNDGMVNLPTADAGVVFGLKKWARKLRKSRLKPKQVVSKISNFIKKTFPSDMPLVVLDDMNLRNEVEYGPGIRKFLFKNMNCKFFLLREFCTNKEHYDERVKPFSICCNNNDSLIKDIKDKNIDLYFRGDNSSPDRKKYLKQIQKIDVKKEMLVYSGGEKSPKKIARNEFLNNLSLAKFCLCFAGHGYCTFRYQEIPSVGSIVVQPEYPWKVYKDYEDMVSCVKFTSVKDLKNKLDYLLKNPSEIEKMSKAAVSNFKEHHSTESRFSQFKKYLERM